MRKLTTAALVALVGVVAPAIPAEAAASVYLVSTRDFTVSCLAMRGPSTIETVDVVFEVKMGGGRVTVWQATDGYQFQVIPVPQNPPWGCVPLKSPIEAPAEWARD